MNIDVNIPDGVQGDWAVETFTVQDRELSEMLSLMKDGRGVPAGTYKRLTRRGSVVMSNTPDEIRDFYYFVRRASGRVLVNGLGLGVVVKALLDKDDITHITVIEKDPDVIALVASHLNDLRLEIICADALKYKPQSQYDAVWHDIWDGICSDNLPEMTKLHRKYAKRTPYQASWCRTECQRSRWR